MEPDRDKFKHKPGGGDGGLLVPPRQFITDIKLCYDLVRKMFLD